MVNQTFAPKCLIQFRVSSFLAVSKLLKAKKETQDFKSIHDRPAVDEVAYPLLDYTYIDGHFYRSPLTD